MIDGPLFYYTLQNRAEIMTVVFLVELSHVQTAQTLLHINNYY